MFLTPAKGWESPRGIQQTSLQSNFRNDPKLLPEVKTLYKKDLESQMQQNRSKRENLKLQKEEEKYISRLQDQRYKDWEAQRRQKELVYQQTIKSGYQQEIERKRNNSHFEKMKSISSEKNYLRNTLDAIEREKIQNQKTKQYYRDFHRDAQKNHEAAKLHEKLKSQMEKQKDKELMKHHMFANEEKERTYREFMKKKNEEIDRRTNAFRRFASEERAKDQRNDDVIREWQRERDFRLDVKANLEKQAKEQFLRTIREENSRMIFNKNLQKQRENNQKQKERMEVNEINRKIMQQDYLNKMNKFDEQLAYRTSLQLQTEANKNFMKPINSYGNLKKASDSSRPFEKLFRDDITSPPKTERVQSYRMSPTHQELFKHDPITNPIGDDPPRFSPVGSFGRGRGISSRAKHVI